MPLLHHVRAGDPISSEMFNAIVDRLNQIEPPETPQRVFAGELKDAHPGQGIAFDIYIGEWNEDDNAWMFHSVKMREPDKIVKAIDWEIMSSSLAVGDVAFFAPRRSADHRQIWELISAGGGTVGGCLDEDHPGRGVAFDIKIGTWIPANDGWSYGDIVKAIDWRFDVPYPERGATGLFEARASDAFGTIYECVSLDCSSPCDGASSGSGDTCCPDGIRG